MTETVFTYTPSGLTFGRSASAEIGFYLTQLTPSTGHRRCWSSPTQGGVTPDDVAGIFRGSMEHW